ncbi:MAG: hypothetical protein EPO51_15540 [Phenylobacterium sp.]|uniref:hypothetical protein n=1 Tax=Phenylobacterium sp. TaxID=1871053 RepID=UPI0012250667|nr:hypothetical protein [Phenylobacterium sp.]TAJ70923.1 MAG: hypothetical protein EPO51_15540 [Phenylobacterium sp.]
MASSVVVARTKTDGLEYLADGAHGVWTEASDLAQQFINIREATRAAMRLPSRFRAFALPVTQSLN